MFESSFSGGMGFSGNSYIDYNIYQDVTGGTSYNKKSRRSSTGSSNALIESSISLILAIVPGLFLNLLICNYLGKILETDNIGLFIINLIFFSPSILFVAIIFSHFERKITKKLSMADFKVSNKSIKEIEKEIFKLAKQIYNNFNIYRNIVLLHGLSEVAKYRAEQLSCNFKSDYYEIVEAYKKLNYGVADSCSVDDNRFNTNCNELIFKNKVYKSKFETIGNIIYLVNSDYYFRFLSSRQRVYMGIGCYYKDGFIYTCIKINPDIYEKTQK